MDESDSKENSITNSPKVQKIKSYSGKNVEIYKYKDKNATNNNKKENAKENNNTIKEIKAKVNSKQTVRLMDKLRTAKSKVVTSLNLLKKIEKYNEINYNHIDLPYFEVHEIKEIILYYNYLKEAIEMKKKNLSISEYIKNTYLDSSFHLPLANEQFSKKELLIIFQYFEITKKKAGESFGELALQREDNKRTGTALITTDCILGFLSRTDYNTYLGDIEVKKRKNDINFVISFAIFDKMNKNVFENRYFNYFKRETFFQGQTIILQDQKINKMFYIKEGQYEITTNLSIAKIYSILQYKTKKKIDDNKKIKIKNQNFNMRLYICYNKDILGLDDCCFKDGISFITAKCLTSKGVAFTIEKSILNEIKIKIPEIEKKIN